MSGILIAGTSSGSGKTTISIAIMAALKNRGLTVQPYKTGPDYIDPEFHEFVTGTPSYNLDAYLVDEDNLRFLYQRTNKSQNIQIIEGVMGMYDGFGVLNPVGSSAELAKTLQLPIILVIDGSGVSTSAAAMVLGFAQLDPVVHIAGVIVNQVSGEVHYQMVKQAIEVKTGISCLGYLKKNAAIELQSRHLGLIPANEVEALKTKVSALANMAEETIALDTLVEIARRPMPEKDSPSSKIEQFIAKNRLDFEGKRIGVAYSQAFRFYYQSNFDLLDALGVELVRFDPAVDEKLPENLDAVYIGGGFPEVFAKELSANHVFLLDLRNQLENGLRCYAECGGLMYLSRSITTLEGETYDMVGFIDADSRMTKRLQRFGYIEVDFGEIHFRAHEFHRSALYNEGELDFQYQVRKYRDDVLVREYECGIKKNNTLCGYPHVHFLSNPAFIRKVFL